MIMLRYFFRQPESTIEALPEYTAVLPQGKTKNPLLTTHCSLFQLPRPTFFPIQIMVNQLCRQLIGVGCQAGDFGGGQLFDCG